MMVVLVWVQLLHVAAYGNDYVGGLAGSLEELAALGSCCLLTPCALR